MKLLLKNKKGIALFIAMIVVSAITLIVLAIADITFKEQILSYSGKDSKTAFNAADAGLECALYHDVKKLGFHFSTNSSDPQNGDIVCNEDTVANVATSTPVMYPAATPTSATTIFYFNIDWRNGHGNGDTSPTQSCSIVSVEKTLVNGGPNIHTSIEARGYNNRCEDNPILGNPPSVKPGDRNLERALEVDY